MLKLLASIALWLCAFPLLATHLVGGEMTYQYLGDDEYEITLYVYRDCSPDNTLGTGFDFSAAIGVFENGSLYTTLNVNMDSESVAELPTPDDDPCVIVPSSVCIERATYIVTVNLPPSEFGYHLAYQRCCRTPAIINLVVPEDLGNTIVAFIPAAGIVNGNNSSPVFGGLPPILLCTNFEFGMDHSGQDAEGDSLVYSLCNPFHGASDTNPIPNPPSTPPYTNVTWAAGYDWDNPISADEPFTIHPITGWLSGTPNQAGKYAVGVCIEEYRNGVFLGYVIRDFMFNVVNCTQVAAAHIEPQPDPCAGTFVEFINNSINANDVLWDFGVPGEDGDTSDLFEPSFDFPGEGIFEVTLIINPGDICSDTTTAIFETWSPIDPTFEISEPFCAGNGMAIDPLGGGVYQDGDMFNWTFDGPATPEDSDLLDPSLVIYTVPGTYDISFEISNANCLEVVTQSVEIPPFPIAQIQPQFDYCTGLTFDFVNESTFATTWWWDFGLPGWEDTSAEENPTYTYAEYGTYNVLLVASPESDCADTSFVEIIVSPENPVVFAYDFETGDPCDSIPVALGLYTGSEVDLVEWDMGDGTELEGVEVQHIYDAEGHYTVNLTIHYELCDIIQTEEIDIFYQSEALGDLVRMPNVISPTQDELNERLRPFVLGESDGILPEGRNVFDYISGYRMQVFDRWGVQLHDTESGILWWDGTIGGEVVSEGTYYFMVEYLEQCASDPTQYSGHVEVLHR